MVQTSGPSYAFAVAGEQPSHESQRHPPLPLADPSYSRLCVPSPIAKSATS